MTEEKLTLEDVRLYKIKGVNKKHVRLWVDALRSGRFLQTTGRLAGQQEKGARWRYCCLGVACEVAPDIPVSIIELGGTTRFVKEYDYNNTAVLPAGVIEWLGFPEGNPLGFSSDPNCYIVRGPRKGQKTSLSVLNDDYDWTFKMISDLLERDWL